MNSLVKPILMASPLPRLTDLEELLVHEFRACQLLYELAHVERIALSSSDMQLLASSVEQKEVLLDDLSRLSERRQLAAQKICDELGLPAHSSSVQDIIGVLDHEKAEQLSRLREGILAVMNRLRDITRGSLALAEAGLERTERLQGFLLSLHPAPASYGPGGVPARWEPISYSEIDQAV